MKCWGLILGVLLLLAGCATKGGGDGDGVTGTYLQESNVPRNSPLLTRIILKEDGSWEMLGLVKLKGTYTHAGTELRLKPAVPAAVPGTDPVVPSDVVCTLRDGILDVPSGLEGIPASRFKRHEASAPH